MPSALRQVKNAFVSYDANTRRKGTFGQRFKGAQRTARRKLRRGGGHQQPSAC